MMKPRVYLETTIISYFAARPSRDIITAAHQQITHEWWEGRRNNFDVFISQIVLQEVNEGDTGAVQRRMEMIDSIPEIEVNPEAVLLAQALVSGRIVPERAAADALHIAVATVQGMDYLLTWNLKHLANAVIRNAITDTCRQRGYEPPVICTPEELMEV
ncbi:MAG: type II toxin-antitoxin system VapC family toxin [Anaerolineales bacterium]